MFSWTPDKLRFTINLNISKRTSSTAWRSHTVEDLKKDYPAPLAEKDLLSSCWDCRRLQLPVPSRMASATEPPPPRPCPSQGTTSQDWGRDIKGGPSGPEGQLWWVVSSLELPVGWAAAVRSALQLDFSLCPILLPPQLPQTYFPSSP